MIDESVSRRSVVRAAAWSLPVLAVAIAAPAASATDVDLGAFAIYGSCGVLFVSGPGFLLTAGPDAPLPVGTTITIMGSGVANIGVFSVSGGSASVSSPTTTSRLITLTAELPASAVMALRTTLSVMASFTLNASVGIPDGYIATAAKTSGVVDSGATLCSAS